MADWAALKAKRTLREPPASSAAPSTSSPRPDADDGSPAPRQPTSPAVPFSYSHPDLPSSLEVRELSGRGRGVVAEDAIQPGTTLLATAPLVSTLDNANLSSRCSFCFRSVEDLSTNSSPAKLLQCSLCHVVQYCSPSCQKADWTVHKKECQALRSAIKAVGKGQKGVPDTPVRALGRLLWTCELKGDKLRQEVDSLESHRSRLSPDEQERFFQLSVALAQYVGQDTLTKCCSNAAAVLDLCSRFTSNSFALTSPTDLSNLGVSISPLTALFNHSCAPNAVVVFPSFPSPSAPKHMAVVAIRPIAAGEEVLTSYVDLALPRETRRAELRERYKFECRCDECERTEGGVDPRDALLCPKEGCKGLIALPPRHSPVTSVECPACRSSTPYKSVHAALDAAKTAYADAEKEQNTDARVAVLHLQHLLTSLTAPLDSTPSFAPSSYPVLPAFQLLLALQLHAHAPTSTSLSTAQRAWAGAQLVFPPGHPVRAVLRTTLVRLETIPPASDPAHPERELAYWTDVPARQRAIAALVGALKEVEVAYGDGNGAKGGAGKGGEMGRMIRDLISDQEQGIAVARRMQAERMRLEQ